MDYSSTVNIRDRRNQLPAYKARQWYTQSASLDHELVQIGPPCELHDHHPRLRVNGVGLDQSNDIGVSQFLQYSDLPLRIYFALFIFDVNAFDGDKIVVVGVYGRFFTA